MPLCSAYPGPLSILVMDNATVHHGDEILELTDQFGLVSNPQTLILILILYLGVCIEYLPPYSPDLNPIKEAFSKIKVFIRRNNNIFQNVDDNGILYDMRNAMDVIMVEDAMGYFIHSGYF